MCPACMVQWLFCKAPVLPAGNPPSHQSHLMLLSGRERTLPSSLCKISLCNNGTSDRKQSKQLAIHLLTAPSPGFSNVACSLVCSWVQAKLRTHLDHAPPDLVAPVPRRSGPPWTNRSPVPPIRACVRVPGLVWSLRYKPRPSPSAQHFYHRRDAELIVFWRQVVHLSVPAPLPFTHDCSHWEGASTCGPFHKGL